MQLLASSRLSYSGPDVLDVTAAWEGLEEMDQVQIQVRVRRTREGKWEGLLLTGEMFDKKVESAEQKLLVSVSVRCSAMEYNQLGTALIHLLYRLDGALAEVEMAGTDKQR